MSMYAYIDIYILLLCFMFLMTPSFTYTLILQVRSVTMISQRCIYIYIYIFNNSIYRQYNFIYNNMHYYNFVSR